ncbi:MAG TPA: type VI secretion system protein TssA [Gemmatimonadales bacterium]|nr:type VI secretion system protein TssA [Gemmatimonadales bacterium]
MSELPDLLQPIPGQNPAGSALRYDPVYEKIKEARREEADVEQGDWKRARKLADWPLVIKLTQDALATKSKDLQIAAWLTEALVKQDGLGGLQAGLSLLHGMLGQYWDHVYPEIEDGDVELRAAPLNWVGRYLEPAVRSVPVTKSGYDMFKYRESRTVGYDADIKGDEKKQAAREAAIAEHRLTAEEFDKAFGATPKAWYKQLAGDLDGCLNAVRALDEACQQKFGDASPSYGTLVQALEDVQHVAQQLLEKKLQLEPESPSGATARAAAQAGGPWAAAPGALSPEPTSAEDAAARIAGAARFLRTADPRNPAPYLLLRGFRWGELRAGGPDLDPTLLDAPATPVRTQLKRLLLDARWSELLDAGEEVMAAPHGRGWLDLQRYEITACEALGPEYQYVSAALRASLTALLRDFPGLPDLTLMDDTPTANAETRAWLQSGGFVAAAVQAAEEDRARPEPSVEPRRGFGRGALDRAMAEVRAGRPQKGIEVLLREAEQEKSARARFLRRSEATEIMVSTGLEAVALPILRELLDQIEAHKLEDWEAGDAVARPLGLLYRCLEKLGEDAQMKDDLYRRVCRLDPMQAMAFSTASPATDGAGA